MRCILVDNGSLRIDSWCNLCEVAAAVSVRTGIVVEPASVLHSSRIDRATVPANVPEPKTWEQAVKAGLSSGERDFWTVPFFFGPSGAIMEYLPKREAALRRRFGAFSVRHAPFLGDEEPGVEPTLIDLLVSRVSSVIVDRELHRPPVVLVDHGSPRPEVTAVRNRLGNLLEARLSDQVGTVGAASMERRPGREYDFNEPLLERILREPPFDRGDVVVAQLFLSPGRHAGEDGDIAGICAEAEAAQPLLKTHRTELLGNHPQMPDLVAARLEVLRRSAPSGGVREV